MIVEDIEFKELDFQFEMTRDESTEAKKCKGRKKNTELHLDSIKTCKVKTGRTKKINIDNIKTCKPIVKKTQEISIDSIETCKVNKKESTNGIKTLSLAPPKVQNNSFIASVASKSYVEHKKEEKEAAKVMLNKHPYILKKDGLLTNAERQLYDFLNANLPDTITILIKVRLADIIELNQQITRDTKYFYKIACKHIDFIICDKSDLSIICAVELDDFTHDTADRQERDRFIEEVLYECKIKLARIKFKIACIEKEDIKNIENWVYEHQAPDCPECHTKMMVFQSKRRKNFGHRFYGCVNFPKCRENIDID